MRVKFCLECGCLLKCVGNKPWELFYECKNRHFFAYTQGDYQGGSCDVLNQIEELPEDIEKVVDKKCFL